jgi:hypothetical protein
MEQAVAIDELLARWREAERLLSDLAAGSPQWTVQRWLADQARRDYEGRLDEVRAKDRDTQGLTP